MIIALDVGNSQIYGGVFEGEQLKFQFRKDSKSRPSSDELGLFLRDVLRENGMDPATVTDAAFCSVVPDLDHSLKNCFRKYFKKEPFALQLGTKTGLRVRYRNPSEVGADRIANSIAAVEQFPNRNLIIIDFGTATTFCAISNDKDYLGGVIVAGVRLCAEALGTKTAKLPSVEILKPETALGRATTESIQSGMYYGAIGQAKEIVFRITQEAFASDPASKPLVIGTGGMASLFADAGVFDVEVPDLVLQGLRIALQMNRV